MNIIAYVTPLIPYFPKIFGVESLFPPFYFIYFLVALMVVAFVHEFAHGVYMKLFKIRIKSTGIAFLGPILGAFVEQEEKDMVKKPRSEQMTILAAGTFSNIMTSIIFFGLLATFFFLAFSQSGYIFNAYAMSQIDINNIDIIKNNDSNFTEIIAGNRSYLLDNALAIQLQTNATKIIVYDNAPAVKAGLQGAIIKVNGENVKNQRDLQKIIAGKKPGDKIFVVTDLKNEEKNYELTLGINPANNSIGYLGIGSYQSQANGVISKFALKYINFKNSSTYYKPRIDGNFVVFVYNFLWWVVVINLFVALFNMLPLGILDGGRFFYLAVFGLTKSEKFAKKVFKFVTYAIIFMFILMMFFWFLRVF